MPQTPNSATAPYCTAQRFFDFYAPQLSADMLRANPDAPRPSYLAMIDPANPAGQRLLVMLGKGAGEIESACAIALRYTPADLQALTGVSADLLQGLNAARAMWAVYQVLKPGSARQEDCPAAKESYELLKLLRDGERIFSFIETQEAGLPSVVGPNTSKLKTPDVVLYSARLFPGYGSGRGLGGYRNNQG